LETILAWADWAGICFGADKRAVIYQRPPKTKWFLLPNSPPPARPHEFAI
jgi:hypothetical protein